MGPKITPGKSLAAFFFGCVPLPEWTGMGIITGMDYRNGHYDVELCVLNIFYMHKMYFCSHINSLHQMNFIQV